MESLGIEQVQVLILAGAIVALIARRLRIPYTVGLVVAGIIAGGIVSFLPVPFEIHLSKDLLFRVLLPPLIFEAALYIDWKKLRLDFALISVYATVGVLLSAAVTALFMNIAAGWTWDAAILFGVLIAATDPVAVIATFKEAGVKGRLRLLVESESLFNDSTAAVGFGVALAFASGVGTGIGSSVLLMIVSVVGGILSGLFAAGISLLVIGSTQDHLVELSMTTVAAFGSFWLAEHFQTSGILAATTAGLVVGNFARRGTITARGQEYVRNFWDFAAFVANTIIFIILGISLAFQDFALAIIPAIVAIVAVIVGRVVAVYPCSALFGLTSRKVTATHQHILFWGGLRGALALALALSIPPTLPYRQAILTVTFAVVAFSVFVQGLTIPMLLRRTGVIRAQNNAQL
jgi:monovalent cation:H+ antiporter, CPA1 family